MRTCRRYLLDQEFETHKHLITGMVLDVGGKKNNRRSRFDPNKISVLNWHYVNIDSLSNPDFIAFAEHLSITDCSVDTLILAEVLEYLESPYDAVCEMYRVLVQGGCGIITVPFLVPVHGDHWLDRQRFTSLKLKELLLGAGFSSISITPMGGVGSVLYDIFHVFCGYAQEGNHSIWVAFFQKCIQRMRPLFFVLDSLSSPHKKFINSGYFIVVKK